MSTDANASIEILDARRLGGSEWAKINLDRDYALFDLLSGARSEDASMALFAPRPAGPDGAVWTGATWLWASELDAVAAVYKERSGRETAELQAISAAMRQLNGTNAQRTRCVFTFF